MITWLTKKGHWVAAATKHPVAIRWRMWGVPDTDKQIPIMSGTNIDLINNVAITPWKMDCCISMFDVWGLKKPIKRHIPWVPIDTENVSEKIVKVLKETPMQIAMSRHGQRELEANGLEPLYAPIGYDPAIFHPEPEKAQEFREAMIWPDGLKADEMFLIGSVGLNYPDDRKGFVILLQAFKEFRVKHPEARLFIHTQPCKKNEGLNYARIAQELDIMDYVGWPDPTQFWLGQYTEEDLAGLYSAFDVFCLPTRGEGFGMPVVEAQACGTPAIVTRNTTGEELCRTGWLIETAYDDYVYTGLNTWRVQPRASEVVKCLEDAIGTWPYLSNNACPNGVELYSWPNVWKNHWEPIIAEIESRLPLPDMTEEE